MRQTLAPLPVDRLTAAPVCRPLCRPVLGAVVGLALGLAMAGCAIPNQAQQAQDAAYDLATGARIGRLDLALTHVAPGSRLAYVNAHRAWHRSVRIVDLDLTAVQMRDHGECNVLLSVGWSRTDDTIVRSTTLAQRWKSEHGQWLLLEEVPVDGDQGLLATLPGNAIHPTATNPALGASPETMAPLGAPPEIP